MNECKVKIINIENVTHDVEVLDDTSFILTIIQSK